MPHVNLKHLVITVAVMVTMSATLLSYAAQEGSLDETIAAINARYEEEWKSVQRASASIKDDAPEGFETAVGVDVDCEMKRNEIKLDIPEVAMKLQTLALDLPQVSMRTDRIVWDNPETHIATTTCGWYPEFHGFEVSMTPIKCDLPQVRMVRREAKLDIPELTWARTDLKMHIPEFRMETQRWTFDLPDCKVKEVSAETRRLKKNSEELQRRSSSLAQEQQQEIYAVVLANLVQKRGEADAAFTTAITTVESAIAQVRSYGLDPTNIPQQEAGSLNLISQLQQIQENRIAELTKLDEEIAKLST